jgi:hypothetical protein
MNARQIAQVAADAGHVAHLEERDPPVPGGNKKWWAVCSCGYRSNARLARVAAVGTAVHHIAKVAEKLDHERRNNGGVSLPSIVRDIA